MMRDYNTCDLHHIRLGKSNQENEICSMQPAAEIRNTNKTLVVKLEEELRHQTERKVMEA